MVCQNLKNKRLTNKSTFIMSELTYNSELQTNIDKILCINKKQLSVTPTKFDTLPPKKHVKKHNRVKSLEYSEMFNSKVVASDFEQTTSDFFSPNHTKKFSFGFESISKMSSDKERSFYPKRYLSTILGEKPTRKENSTDKTLQHKSQLKKKLTKIKEEKEKGEIVET